MPSITLQSDCHAMQMTGRLHSIHISLLWRTKNILFLPCVYLYITMQYTLFLTFVSLGHVLDENVAKAKIVKAVEKSLDEVLYELTLQYPLIFSEDYNNVRYMASGL